jgi:septal ring factor EnvC (AmiA/AmiB activator)
MKNSREKMKNSKGNYNISDEKKFCENEILEKLLAKMKKLREDFEEMKNEINELKSNNNNTNNTLINNIDKFLNELKSKKKVDDQHNDELLFGSRNECYNRKYLVELLKSGNLDAIKQYICCYYARVVNLNNELIFLDKKIIHIYIKHLMILI